MTKKQKIISGIILIIFLFTSLLMILPPPSSQSSSQLLLKEHLKTNKNEFVNEIKNLTTEKENIEFFSFFCPHCYDFEYKYGIVPEIKNNNISLNQYHVDFMTENSNVFTHAWSIAIVLKKENNLFNIEQVKERLFNLAQDLNGNGLKIKNVNELYDLVFKDLIDLVAFETTSKSEDVKALILKQEKLLELLEVRSVPSFFQINPKSENEIKIEHINTSKYHEKGINTVKEFREEIVKDFKKMN